MVFPDFFKPMACMSGIITSQSLSQVTVYNIESMEGLSVDPTDWDGKCQIFLLQFQ